MTVCIAAIFNNSTILGAADRMISSGGGFIEYETPEQTKIFPVTRSIVVMTAGDTSIQAQILSKISSFVNERIAEFPDKWIPVIDVASKYRDCYLELKAEQVEKSILAPLGLTYNTFIARQHEMSADFIENISYKIQKYEIEGIETIVTGIDTTGAHIFVVNNDVVNCSDMIGFESIGIGNAHAQSHLMLSGYSRYTIGPKALLNIHQAKKKAEVSAGVGKLTQMFIIGPNIGTYQPIEPTFGVDIVKDLDKLYDKHINRIKKEDTKMEETLKKYIEDLANRPAQPQSTNTSPSPSSSPEVPETEVVRKP